MENKPTLPEALSRMNELEEEMKKLGVPIEAIPAVMERIDEYTELKSSLESARDAQFYDDAYSILAGVQSVSNKALKQLTTKLRGFAEHIAEQTLILHEAYGADHRTIVDHIPTMESQIEESGGE